MALASAPPRHISFLCFVLLTAITWVGSGGIVDMSRLRVWAQSTGVVIGHIISTAPTIIPIFVVLYRVGVCWCVVEALLGLLVCMLIENWRPHPLLLSLGIVLVLVGATVASTISMATSTSGAPISTADFVEGGTGQSIILLDWHVLLGGGLVECRCVLAGCSVLVAMLCLSLWFCLYHIGKALHFSC